MAGLTHISPSQESLLHFLHQAVALEGAEGQDQTRRNLMLHAAVLAGNEDKLPHIDEVHSYLLNTLAISN